MKTILKVEIPVNEDKRIEKQDFEKKSSLEADVIVTAVVLGFIGTRYHLNQPCRFDHEHPSPASYENGYYGDVGYRKMKRAKEEEFLKEFQDFQHVMSAMSFVLDKSEPGMGAFLKGSQSAEWVPGALITGRAGGQMMEADERHREMQKESSKEKAKIVTEMQKSLLAAGPDSLYVGKGAYTGMIDDPVNGAVVIQRTKRVIDPDENRWKPGAGVSETPWGLIVALDKDKKNTHLESLEKGGLGELRDEFNAFKDGERVGYIHGMTAAINKCISAGPWCTPYELATGTDTTKMASCFACTTYMYATGFPPSSTHLGRGESWVPPKPKLVSGEKIDAEMPRYLIEQISKPLVERWHWEIHHYLQLGHKYLSNAIKVQKDEKKKLENAKIERNIIHYVNEDHSPLVDKLGEALIAIAVDKISEVGGNLFLDALTVHDSDWKRVMRTLQPVYDHYNYEIEGKRLSNEINAGNILVK
ncbi:MAG TPA: hypothetical protein VJ810_29410 [Blastocatellia bacterium]|nr:hypothetical protein [Blastocatellia bacterium]